MSNFNEEYIETRKRVIAADFPHLNDMQREAVMATEGPLLVLAGAGSGKTTAVIARIANLLKYGRGADSDELPPDADEEKLQAMRDYLAGDKAAKFDAQRAAALDPASPWQILAITFTNKAADEMKDRLRRQLGEYADGVWARTFHSACVRILRRDADKLGFGKDFSIYDRSDAESLVKRIVKEQNRDEKQFAAKDVLGIIDRARNAMQTPSMLRAEAESLGDLRLQTMADLYAEYARRLKADNAMDFEDLIYMTVRLLTEHEDVLEYYRTRFRYVMVDEYQDTNRLQSRLAGLLAGGHNNICVVGDDDQSIYAFRGAVVENILRFSSVFPGTRTIRLEQNYRSTGHILGAANGVVKNNHDRKGKKLWTQADDGEPVHLITAADENDEARKIVNKTLELVRMGETQLRDVAVLYRTNAQSRALEQAFLRSGIRPRIVKGNAFFERAEIKDVMAYFFVLHNPADEVRLERIINTPARGIGAATIERVREIAGRNGIPMFTVVSMADQFPELGRAKEKLLAFAGMMNELYAMTAQGGMEALYDTLMEKTGYLRVLAEKDTEENKTRAENVRELKSFIANHVAESGDDTLAGFLDEVSLYTDLQNMDENENTVSLMTIHSAKGLEFDVVFLSGMEEGVFPGLSAIGMPEEMQEERRLAYVGITRAKRYLFLTSARQRMVYGKTTPHKISRFADEIPPEHIERPEAGLRRAPFDFDDVAFDDFGDFGGFGDDDFDQRPRYSSGGRNPSGGGWNAASGSRGWGSSSGGSGRNSAFGGSGRSSVSRGGTGNYAPQRERKTGPAAPQPIRPAARPVRTLPALKPGDRVRHKSFGDGTIAALTRMGGDALVEIRFDGEEKSRRLMLKAAAPHMIKIE